MDSLLTAALYMKRKRCRGCDKVKPFGEFNKCSKLRDKLKTQCRECQAWQNKKYRKKPGVRKHEKVRKRMLQRKEQRARGKKMKVKDGDDTLEEDYKTKKWLKLPAADVVALATTAEQNAVKAATLKEAMLKEATLKLKKIQLEMQKQEAIVALLGAA